MYSLWFRADDVLNFDEKDLPKLDGLPVERAYLVTHDKNANPLPVASLEKVRRALEKNNIEVRGGVIPCTVYGDKPKMFHGGNVFFGYTACATGERTVEGTLRAVRSAAEVFDYILLDDLFQFGGFITCYCNRCVSMFNQKYGTSFGRLKLAMKVLRHPEWMEKWTAFHQDVMNDLARKIVEAAKDVNAKVRVVQKLFPCYDFYPEYGLDLKTLSGIYDGFFVGTETRNEFYPYRAFFIYRYFKSVVGKKMEGAWIDSLKNGIVEAPIECELSTKTSDPDVFAGQALLSFAAGAEEVVLWRFGNMVHPSRAEHKKKLPTARFDLGEPKGIRFEKDVTPPEMLVFRGLNAIRMPLAGGSLGVLGPRKFGSSGDLCVFDLFGMSGVPLTDLPSDLTLVTRHNSRLPDGDLLLTHNAVKKFNVSGTRRGNLITNKGNGAVYGLRKPVYKSLPELREIESKYGMDLDAPFGVIYQPFERGEFVLNTADRKTEVRLNGRSMALNPREYRIL